MADNIKDLINQAINEVIEVSGDGQVLVGTALQSITALPLEMLHGEILARLGRVTLAQSILNASELSEDELDGLAANILVTRDAGQNATGSVRVYFNEAQSFNITRGAIFQTDDGLRFFTVQPVSITKESMSLNIDQGRFYLDVPLVSAEGAGEEYNVASGAITSFLAGGEAVVDVTNLTALAGGRDAESNEDLVARMPDAVSERSLNIRRAINTLVQQNFPEVDHVYAAGFNDPEMNLDVRYGVHSGGEVFVHLHSTRFDAYEEIITNFNDNIRYIGGTDVSPKYYHVAFARREAIVEGSVSRSSTHAFTGNPASLQLDADPGEALEVGNAIDSQAKFEITQQVNEEAQSFSPAGEIGAQFTVNNPGRKLRNVEVKAASDGSVYFCGLDFRVDAESGVFTRLRDTVEDDVLVSYTWVAQASVDYLPDDQLWSNGVVTARSEGSSLLSAGDVVTVQFNYFRDGRRDDSDYTLTNLPVVRVEHVYELDATDNILNELTFVAPRFNGPADAGLATYLDRDFSINLTAAAAPASDPWYTVVPIWWKSVPDPSYSGQDDPLTMIDSAGVFHSFTSTLTPTFLTIVGDALDVAQIWPQAGSLRYTSHEELMFIFGNGDGPGAFNNSTRFRVEYDVQSSVRVVQDYLHDPEQRVLCARQLSRAYVPVEVDIDLYGVVGTASQVVDAVTDYINELEPGVALRVSDLVDVILDEDLGGATSVVSPFTINAVVKLPSGREELISSSGEIDPEAELSQREVIWAPGPSLDEAEYVSNRNMKFRARNIIVRT